MASDVQLITKTDTKQLSGNLPKSCDDMHQMPHDGATSRLLAIYRSLATCKLLQSGVRLEINTLPANLIFMQFSWGKENFLPGKVTALPSGCRC